MKREIRTLAFIGGSAVVLAMLIYPVISSLAQKDQDHNSRKTQKHEVALQIVRQNVVSNIFYETLQNRETGYILIEATTGGGGEVVTKRGIEQEATSVNLVLKLNSSKAEVFISEYSSEQAAKLSLNFPISQGRIEKCKAEECGIEGQKIYSQNGIFSSMAFTSGRFHVSIHCKSEEAAKLLARHAVSAVAGR